MTLSLQPMASLTHSQSRANDGMVWEGVGLVRARLMVLHC